MMTTVVATTQFEGIHRYPEAPSEVAYLRIPHRHMFGVVVEMEVFGDDREVEFIMLKHTIDGWLDNQYPKTYGVWEMDTLSCEQVASKLVEFLRHKYCYPKERWMAVTVTEDGENGAVVNNEAWGAKDMERKPAPPEDKLEPFTLNKYQCNAYKNIQSHDNTKEEVMHWAIGLGEESGETLSVIKHLYYGGHYENEDQFIEDLVAELGDALWHIAALCTVFGLNMSDVAAYNLAKLDDRYPGERFVQSRSEERHELYGQWKSTEQYKEMLRTLLENRKENLRRWEAKDSK